jgi:hypothetical protein
MEYVVITPHTGDLEPAEFKTKLIPQATFAGTIYQLGSVQNGQLVACDTDEQGGGRD